MWTRAFLAIFLIVLAGPAFAQTTSVEFVMLDTETQGNWKGVYGQDGFNIIIDTEAYPSYADVVASGKSDYTWNASTTDVRAMERAAGTDRLAACWFQSTPWTIDIDLTDGRKHQVAVYFLDWDSTVRGTNVEVQDAATGEVLDTQEMTDYNAGKYLVWEIRGHVVINILHAAGANSVISGLFFDKAANKGASENPSPMDTVDDVPRDALLSWAPGMFAVKHDVYFGTVFEDVNDADSTNPMNVLASPEQDANTFDPGRLDFGQTYFWRVDEVNGAPDRTVYPMVAYYSVAI